MTHPIITLGEFLQAQWLDAVAAIRAAHEQRLLILSRTTKHFNDTDVYLLHLWDTRVDLAGMFSQHARTLIREMRTYLLAQGYPVSVDERFAAAAWGSAPRARDCLDEDSERFYLREIDFAQTRSLVKLAQDLADRYMPERASREALAEAAERVHAFFKKPADHPLAGIRTVGGARVLATKLFSVAAWRIRPDTARYLEQIVADMAFLTSHIACLVSEQGLADALKVECAHTRQRNESFFKDGIYASRMELEFGQLRLLFFKGKLEWHFPPRVLDALQIAVESYRRPERQAA